MNKKKILFVFSFFITQINTMFYSRCFLHRKASRNYFKVKNTKIIKRFYEKLSKKDIEFCGYTPLHVVFVSDRYKNTNSRKNTLKRLIKRGDNPNVQDIFGHTPLHWAIRLNDLEYITLLIQAGADPNIKNFRKETPLEIAGRLQNDYINHWDYLDKLVNNENGKDDWSRIVAYLSSYKSDIQH